MSTRTAAGVVLSVLASTAGVALTATAGWLIVRSAEHPPVLMLMVAIVGVRTFGLARPVLRYAERLITHDVALRELAARRARVYDALVPLVPGRLGRRRGDVLASVVDDVDAEVDALVRVRVPVLTWLGTTALTSLAVLLFLPLAAPVVAACGLGSGGVAGAVGLAGSRRHGAERVAARAELSSRVLATLQDVRPLVRWQAEDCALARVDAAGADLARATRGAAGWLAVGRAWPVLCAGPGMLAVAALAEGRVSGPVLALLVLVPLALVDVAGPLADAGALRHETRAARARLDALTGLDPSVVDPARPGAVDSADLELTDVTATWDAARALPATSLTVRPGRAVGVVGPSGSGKSTLAAVLVRFLTPTSGRHLLGGADVGGFRADDVRRRVGLLDDDPYLFATTLAENVRLARPGASDDDVERAVRAAHLGEWLDALPRGLATRIGDGAEAVSGGERARIGLARLLLAEHDVLVLDEPTAHLDTATARAVTDDLLALRERPGGPGLVWITHSTHGLDRMDDVLDLTPR
ncbi:thiol reductant ABC exporter subunit CydC [Nocardioides sp. 1609]|uniref:thiol reductant ABC exporter subunit CydC n=1 Tax=Nocardioides sp. 1609 TaxID=2508327 RepID=UPI001FD652D4|nr:thiol reductant ABC exporter subunit CydC [Nocardioides sp. 1609]